MILHVVYNTHNIHELKKDFFSVNFTESVGEGFHEMETGLPH